MKMLELKPTPTGQMSWFGKPDVRRLPLGRKCIAVQFLLNCDMTGHCRNHQRPLARYPRFPYRLRGLDREIQPARSICSISKPHAYLFQPQSYLSVKCSGAGKTAVQNW